MTANGPDHVGELVFAPLADSSPQAPAAAYERLSMQGWAGTLPPRKKAAHKGSFGHLVVIGGGRGMGGAVMLAAEAALHSGAGKISVVTRSEHVAPLLARCPELMVHGMDDAAQLEALLAQADAVVIGPGLGRDAWARLLLKAVLAWPTR